jgi:hypothetical protein
MLPASLQSPWLYQQGQKISRSAVEMLLPLSILRLPGGKGAKVPFLLRSPHPAIIRKIEVSCCSRNDSRHHCRSSFLSSSTFSSSLFSVAGKLWTSPPAVAQVLTPPPRPVLNNLSRHKSISRSRIESPQR